MQSKQTLWYSRAKSYVQFRYMRPVPLGGVFQRSWCSVWLVGPPRKPTACVKTIRMSLLIQVLGTLAFRRLGTGSGGTCLCLDRWGNTPIIVGGDGRGWRVGDVMYFTRLCSFPRTWSDRRANRMFIILVNTSKVVCCLIFTTYTLVSTIRVIWYSLLQNQRLLIWKCCSVNTPWY